VDGGEDLISNGELVDVFGYSSALHTYKHLSRFVGLFFFPKKLKPIESNTSLTLAPVTELVSKKTAFKLDANSHPLVTGTFVESSQSTDSTQKSTLM